MRNFIRELCPAVFYIYGGYGEPMFLVSRWTVIVLFFDGRFYFNFKPLYTNKKVQLQMDFLISPAVAGLSFISNKMSSYSWTF